MSKFRHYTDAIHANSVSCYNKHVLLTNSVNSELDKWMESVKQYINIVYQCAIKGTKPYQFDRYKKHYDRTGINGRKCLEIGANYTERE